MNMLVDYPTWKEHCKDTVFAVCKDVDNFDEIVEVADRLNFKGYMTTPVAIDKNETVLEAKSRAVDNLHELYNYDFSNCYLYKIEKINYTHFFTPEGTNPWDYDAAELSKFDNETRFGYRIRFAGKEKTKEKA